MIATATAEALAQIFMQEAMRSAWFRMLALDVAEMQSAKRAQCGVSQLARKQ
jgi:hypothetical protein